ncbi:MAG: mechanosensitive ion channel family protein [Pseudomonadota bacterium]
MDASMTQAAMDQLRDHLISLSEMGPRVAAALALLAVTWATARIVRWLVTRVARRIVRRDALVEVLMMLSVGGVWLAGLLIASAVAFPSITPADVLTVLGLGSVAIGFAFKDIFENFIAGILILIRGPFAFGDHVVCGEIEGAIERISVRDTHVRRTDGQLVVVPNADLFKNPVTVRTNRELRRTSILCGVAYGEDADEARRVIEQAVVAVDSVRDDVRDVQVFARGFGASSVDFEIAWWTGSRPINIRASRDQVVRAVKRALDSAGIEIPFPQRVVTVREETRDGHPAQDEGAGPDGKLQARTSRSHADA